MDNLSPIGFGMTTPGTYQIIVNGKLDHYWGDWFNGTTTLEENQLDGYPQTTLLCQVRDQAELLGILNQLNSLNLPLIQLTLTNYPSTGSQGEAP